MQTEFLHKTGSTTILEEEYEIRTSIENFPNFSHPDYLNEVGTLFNLINDLENNDQETRNWDKKDSFIHSVSYTFTRGDRELKTEVIIKPKADLTLKILKSYHSKITKD